MTKFRKAKKLISFALILAALVFLGISIMDGIERSSRIDQCIRDHAVNGLITDWDLRVCRMDLQR